MKNIFIVTAYTIREDDDEEGKIAFNSKGSVPVTEHCLGVFSTVKKSEKIIKDWILWTKGWDPIILGFIVEEKTLDEGFIVIDGTRNICQHKTMRSYLSDGSFNCMSDCDDVCITKFKGRKEEVKLKTNDIALVLCGLEVTAAIVTQLPIMEDEWRDRFPETTGDFTDDSYTVVSDSGHDHPFTPYVFPLVGKNFPKSLQRKLFKRRAQYLNGEIL